MQCPHGPACCPPPLPQEALTGPHLAAAPPEVAGSSLKFANHFYPSADSLGGVRVVCACGDAIRGRPLLGGGSRGSSGDETDSYGSGFALSYASVGSEDEGGGSSRAGGGKPYSRYDEFLAFNSYKVGGIRVFCLCQCCSCNRMATGPWHACIAVCAIHARQPCLLALRALCCTPTSPHG